MDVKQMAAMCGQMMAGASEEGGETAKLREQSGQMAAMCGGPGEATGMLKHCEQMTARFAGHSGKAEQSEQGEPEGSQPV